MTNEDEEIKYLLEKYRTIAVMGLSRDPTKDSYRVAEYLKANGYRVVPINPFATEILGEKCYKTLLDVPENLLNTIEIIDIFRPAQDVPPIVDQVIQLRERGGNPRVVWIQLEIVNEEAAKRARNAGLTVVMDKCMMIEHNRIICGGFTG